MGSMFPPHTSWGFLGRFSDLAESQCLSSYKKILTRYMKGSVEDLLDYSAERTRLVLTGHCAQQMQVNMDFIIAS